MYLMQKASGSNVNYLTKAEEEMLRTNKQGYEAFRQKNNLKDNPKAFAKYLNDSNNHEKAVFSGGLAEKWNLQYDNETFASLMSGNNPFTKEQWTKLNPELAYKKDGRLIRNSDNAKLGESMVLTLPKSLSVVYAISTPAQQRSIREAVNKADSVISKEMAKYVKPGSGSGGYVFDWQIKENPEAYKDIPKSKILDSSKTKLCFAEFWHYENRSGKEPNIHKHKQLLPMGEFTTMDGKTKMLAIDNQALYDHQKRMTSDFNTLLTQELEQIGIATQEDRQHDNQFSFRVAGIERIEELKLSSRRNEMLEKINLTDGKYIPSSLNHLQYLARIELREKTANDKQGLNYEEVHNIIKKSSEEVLGKNGLENFQKAQQEAQGKKVAQEDKFNIENMKELTMGGETTIPNVKAEIGNILRFSGRKFKDIEELHNAVNTEYKNLIDNKILVVKDSGKITSRTNIYNEYKSIEVAKSLIEKGRTLNNTEEAQFNKQFLDKYTNALPEKFKMFEGQQASCESISSGKPLIFISGYAGSGKTHSSCKYFNALYTSKEYIKQFGEARIIATSTQTKTAKALAEVGFKETLNTQALCYEFYDYKKGQWKEEAFNNPKNQHLKILVDEAGMISATDYMVLTGIADRLNSKQGTSCQLVLVGHSSQLQSVGAGNVFTKLEDIIKKQDQTCYTTLDKVIRHETEGQKQLADALLDKNSKLAVDILKENGWLNTTKKGSKREQLYEQLANDYVNDNEHKNKVAIAFTNEDCQTLNDNIRLKLIEAQRNPKSPYYYDKNKIEVEKQVPIDVFNKGKSKTSKEGTTRFFAPGDKIIFTEQTPEIASKDSKGNYQQAKEGRKKLVIANSTQGIITNIEKDGKDNHILTVNIDGQEKKIFTELESHRNFTHAFAITTHQSQGITDEGTYALLSEKQNANMNYVMFTRSKFYTKAYIQEEHIDGFIKSGKEEMVKASSLDDTNCRNFFFNELIENNQKQTQELEKLPEEIKYKLQNGISLENTMGTLSQSQQQIQSLVLTKEQELKIEQQKEGVLNNTPTLEKAEIIKDIPQQTPTIELSPAELKTMLINGENIDNKYKQEVEKVLENINAFEMCEIIDSNPRFYENNIDFLANTKNKNTYANEYINSNNRHSPIEADLILLDNYNLVNEKLLEKVVLNDNLLVNDPLLNDYLTKEQVKGIEIKYQEQEMERNKPLYDHKIDNSQWSDLSKQQNQAYNKQNYGEIKEIKQQKDEFLNGVALFGGLQDPNYVKNIDKSIINNPKIVEELTKMINNGLVENDTELFKAIESKVSTQNYKAIVESLVDDGTISKEKYDSVIKEKTKEEFYDKLPKPANTLTKDDLNFNKPKQQQKQQDGPRMKM